MARTIMVSDEVYEELSRLKKPSNYSFSELLIKEFLEKSRSKSTFESIMHLKGKWKESKKDEKIEKEINRMWKNWGKTYA